ncbi:MAG TPA: hypothetical protein VGI81_11090 [Tepidisphaeraceae bacterium]|jgi:hypothetical protein
MAMAQNTRTFHPLPVIGHPEAWYTKHIEQADAAGDHLAHCAYKVGQYVTLALDPKRPWEEKVKYFRHCLKRHCTPAGEADPDTLAFCDKLRALVLRYGSQEARKMARHEHDAYAMRLDFGVPKDTLAEEAEVFFPRILGHGACPDYLTQEAFQEICVMRDRWI